MSKRLTTEEFIQRAREVHGNKYDYSKVEYVNTSTPVCIICPKHGEFWMKPNDHISTNRRQCPKCQHQSYAYTTEEFIQKVEERFPNKFTFEKTIYKNLRTKVCITCKIHGDIWVAPLFLFRSKYGCKFCGTEHAKEKKKTPLDRLLKKFKEVHNNKYDYSKVEYKNKYTKICIICPKHGEFWQTPNNHICGNGCPKCKSSKLEQEVETYLQEKNILFETQKTFDWLKHKANLYLDFYLPDYNIAIECQGAQHYIECKFFNGKNGLKYRQFLDKKKKELCDKHNIKILYYAKPQFSCTFSNVEDLLKYLTSLKNE